MPHQTQGAERRGDRRGEGRRQRRGGHEGALDRAAKPNRIETKPGTLYKLSPRTSIEKNHVLRSSACSSWIPVRDARCALRITGERRGRGEGGKYDGKRRTSRSLCGIGLFDLDFLQLFLQPSRVDDGHGARWWGGGEVRGAQLLGPGSGVTG